MNELIASHKLSAYIDGDLSPAERADLERALASDPELREEYEQMLAAVELLRMHGPVSAPPDFHRKVMELVADEPAPSVSVWARFRSWLGSVPLESVAVAMAAVLVVVLVGQFGLSKVNDPAPDEGPAEAPEEVAAASPETEDDLAPIEAQTPNAADAAADLIQSAWDEQKPAPPPAERETPEDGVATLDMSEFDQGEAVLDEMRETTEAATPGQQKAEVSGTGEALASELSYRLQLTDSADFKSLMGLVRRFDGVAVHAVTGEPVSIKDLGDNPGVPVRVRLPEENLSGFYDGLRRLGGVTTLNASTGNLHTGGQRGVYLDVVIGGD
jgi:negative regulator of sigma E activity